MTRVLRMKNALLSNSLISPQLQRELAKTQEAAKNKFKKSLETFWIFLFFLTLTSDVGWIVSTFARLAGH